jgi:hypothetical protein
MDVEEIVQDLFDDDLDAVAARLDEAATRVLSALS